MTLQNLFYFFGVLFFISELFSFIGNTIIGFKHSEQILKAVDKMNKEEKEKAAN